MSTAEKTRIQQEEATLGPAARSKHTVLKVKLVQPNSDIQNEIENDLTERLAAEVTPRSPSNLAYEKVYAQVDVAKYAKSPNKLLQQ